MLPVYMAHHVSKTSLPSGSFLRLDFAAFDQEPLQESGRRYHSFKTYSLHLHHQPVSVCDSRVGEPMRNNITRREQVQTQKEVPIRFTTIKLSVEPRKGTELINGEIFSYFLLILLLTVLLLLLS